MKTFINASLAILAIFLLTTSSFAQQASNPPFDFPDHIAWKRLKKFPAPKRSFNRPVPSPQIKTNRWPTR